MTTGRRAVCNPITANLLTELGSRLRACVTPRWVRDNGIARAEANEARRGNRGPESLEQQETPLLLA